MKKYHWTRTTILCAALAAAGCGGDDVENPDEDNEEEVITTMTLRFAPEGGGDEVVATFRDADGDGGGAPTIDEIVLAADTSYSLDIDFLNELENPAESIREEIEAEAEDHQVFITGADVSGPATDVDDDAALLTHSYDDLESDYAPNLEGEDLPVGLLSTVSTAEAGDGELIVTLRHLPPVNDTPVKLPGLAAEVAAGGIGSIAGDTDVSVTFSLRVE